MDSFKKLLLKYKTTPNDIATFCIKNSTFCKQHKNLLCKSVLKSAGYKVSKMFDGHYCQIYKELANILGHKYGNKYLKIDDEIDCSYKKCSDILIDFFKFNNIKIITNTSNLLLQLPQRNRANSRSTVKIIRNFINKIKRKSKERPSIIQSIQSKERPSIIKQKSPSTERPSIQSKRQSMLKKPSLLKIIEEN